MVGVKREQDPWFAEDVKAILGDESGARRAPPSRAEREEYRQLCALLWGRDGDGPMDQRPPLESALAGHLHTQGGETIEIRYADWGGQHVAILPWPRRVPECRLWFLKQGAESEYLIAMLDVTGVAAGHFPDLTAIVGPRLRALFPGSLCRAAEINL